MAISHSLFAIKIIPSFLTTLTRGNPGEQGGFHGLDPLRLLGGQVVLFCLVVQQVVEFVGSAFVFADEFVLIGNPGPLPSKLKADGLSALFSARSAATRLESRSSRDPKVLMLADRLTYQTVSQRPVSARDRAGCRCVY